MIARLLAALAVLSGVADDMPRREAERIAQRYGWRRTRRSSGRIRAALDLAGLPAFNEYRVSTTDPAYGPAEFRQTRNAAKRRRRALRAPKRTPRRAPGDWDFSKIEVRIQSDSHVPPYDGGCAVDSGLSSGRL